jgi:dTDP-4-dehydrorhamnose reductase
VIQSTCAARTVDEPFPELWASPEPTVARIQGDRLRDQLRETGHERRQRDIALLAKLGVRGSRYPVLWEKVAPADPDMRDYRWAERRLHALADARIDPIVTLLHHGSGPRYTSLVDPAFPALFAEYAAATARRFPWVKRWTPINEPLTTARFSTLYSVWYPNGFFDHAAFGRAIVNEMTGFALAARRIREVIPDASFLLTEDLQSFTALDERAAPYVEHKRERMYLSCELLQGRVVPGHPLYRYLTETCAVPAAELAALAECPQPPDVMGWNYYPYSERLVAADPLAPGGFRNEAAVEVAPERLSMLPLLRAAHARLGVPIAFSEVHVIGDEVARSRWLLQRFADALTARREGIPVVAFGPWAAFGMVDWSSLMCQARNDAEDGVYTFAGPRGVPRPTLVADVLSELCAGRLPDLPRRPGWWEMAAQVSGASPA